MITKLTNNMRFYICSMGKIFRVTHVCPDTPSANAVCAKDHDTTIIAEDNNGFVYLAEAYGSIAPSAILKDYGSQPPSAIAFNEEEITELRFIMANINSPSREQAVAAAKEWHLKLTLMLRKIHPSPCAPGNVH